jgi:hypothetical protein
MSHEGEEFYVRYAVEHICPSLCFNMFKKTDIILWGLISLLLAKIPKVKVKISVLQAMEAHRVARG